MGSLNAMLEESGVGASHQLALQYTTTFGPCQVFCNEHGHPLQDLQTHSQLDLQLELDRKMRMFYRYHFMHQYVHCSSPPTALFGCSHSYHTQSTCSTHSCASDSQMLAAITHAQDAPWACGNCSLRIEQSGLLEACIGSNAGFVEGQTLEIYFSTYCPCGRMHAGDI